MSTFLRVLKFLQIKDGGPNFWGEPILENVWIIWSTLVDMNFKSFMQQNSLSLIRFQCILHDSGVLFSEPWNFYKLGRGGPNFLLGGTNFAESLNYLVAASVFQFEKFYGAKFFIN